MKILAALLFPAVLFNQETLPQLSQQSLPQPDLPFAGGKNLDDTIQDAIRRDELPGAVVVVGHNGHTVYQKAYGSRSLVPHREPMTLDTIFDLASLTKVVATTSAIMKLVEQGKVRINDKVTQYLPEFQGGKSEVTVRNLLTHFSGLRPDLDLEPAWSGYETGIQKALSDHPNGSPGTRFVYSDINFVLLGEIVRRTSGESLPRFVKEQVFSPLGMTETRFQPPPELRSRIAPTEVLKGSAEPLRGIVHDPTSRFMGGIAGHAGLFSTAGDLAKFAEMMLGAGERNGVRIFSPLTVRMFTAPQSPPEQPIIRALGWDINSPFSGTRGDLFPLGSYGHTGFTGTSMWLDPYTNSYVILLANAVHPHLRPAITPLRGRVANAAAAGLSVHLPASIPLAGRNSAPVNAGARPQVLGVQTGLDVWIGENFAALRGKSVGLITNHTGISRSGTRNVDAMLAAGVKIRALYSPEHGLSGKQDQENIANEKDAKTGLPVYSLYSGQNRRPTDESLRGVDVLVFDMQDVGARFYTYTCTLKNALEEAGRRKLPFAVLDRPNPITGTHVEGPVLQPDLKSFVGCLEIPVRHGMTIGELARMMNSAIQPRVDLTVVRMANWQRDVWWDATGLSWVDPSPNLRSLNAALLYPGIAMLEGSKTYSVGRGTDAPFEQIGADWIRGDTLAKYLNERNIPGIRVYATSFQPTTSNFAGKTVSGIRFVITDRDSFDSVGFGIALGSALGKLFPGKMNWQADEKLTGNRTVVARMAAGDDPKAIEETYAAELQRFRQRRVEFLLY